MAFIKHNETGVSYTVTSAERAAFKLMDEAGKDAVFSKLGEKAGQGDDVSGLLGDGADQAPEEMSGANEFMAGVGQGVTNLGRGIRDIAGDIGLINEDQHAINEQKVKDARVTDEPLLDSTMGFIGSVVGETAAFGLAAILAGPAAGIVGAIKLGKYGAKATQLMKGVLANIKAPRNAVITKVAQALSGSTAKAAGTGAAYGGILPTVEDDSRALNTGVSAGLMGGMNTVGGGLVKYGKGKLADRATLKAANQSRDEAVATAREVGYKIPAGTTNEKGALPLLERTVGALGGKKIVKDNIADANQDNTNRIIKKELGIPETTPLNKEHLNKNIADALKEQEKVKLLPNVTPDKELGDAFAAATRDYDVIIKDLPSSAKKAMEELKESFKLADGKTSVSIAAALVFVKAQREAANVAYKAGDALLGKATRAYADAVEDMIERGIKDPQVLKIYKANRVKIAKNSAVKASMNENGDVITSVLAKQPAISGNLKKAADYGSTNPSLAKRPPAGNSPVDSMDVAGLATGIGTFAATGGLSIPLAVAGARPGARFLAGKMAGRNTAPNYNTGYRERASGLLGPNVKRFKTPLSIAARRGLLPEDENN